MYLLLCERSSNSNAQKSAAINTAIWGKAPMHALIRSTFKLQLSSLKNALIFSGHSFQCTSLPTSLLAVVFQAKVEPAGKPESATQAELCFLKRDDASQQCQCSCGFLTCVEHRPSRLTLRCSFASCTTVSHHEQIACPMRT